MEYATFAFRNKKTAKDATDYMDSHDMTGEWYIHKNGHKDRAEEEKWILEMTLENSPTEEDISFLKKEGKFLGFAEKTSEKINEADEIEAPVLRKSRAISVTARKIKGTKKRATHR